MQGSVDLCGGDCVMAVNENAAKLFDLFILEFYSLIGGPG